MEKQTMIENLGIHFLEVGKGKIVATMPVDERTIQPFGYLHGGASVALAETVASYGAAQLIDLEKEVCFGLEINANHIRAKQSGQVIATAEVLHQGKSTMVWDVKIRNEEDKLICVSRCTIAIMPKK
ncbi:hotdog fold thioesterase [Lederbergia galactosidilytica]|uniref:Esterase n=1 Tax=Lederbergia galactosidilytica TaxID=217031 RepID=A0A177ZLP6_9BACI|nr:hotdog fold thioesterase [Lederbergia galactosidilytica]KRG15216.1 esterase [Virgibacillus soli]MBP1913120.1 uncharacterized protein (TIGR00369 family) [Lederbergia galactosidilytica]OAK67818.1 esterase [Lederbergia galactosidilytica]